MNEIVWCVTMNLLAGEGSSLGAAYCEREGHVVKPMLLVPADAPSIVVGRYDGSGLYRVNPLGADKPNGLYVYSGPVDEEPTI